MKTLLLIGSAKKPHSNSELLGTYLIDQLRERGADVETVFLHQSMWSNDRRAELFTATDQADVIVLAFPLYIDTLPYIVTKTLEMIAEHRRANDISIRQRFLSIVNCGFPEANHCDTAIAICKQFARETGFEWLGGLALGGGEVIGGQPLHTLGGVVRNTVVALELTANALVEDKPIPQRAIELMAKRFIPNWMYILIGKQGWIQRARKFGMEKRLRDKPYVI